MNARIACFVLVAVGLGLACQSAPPAASPGSSGTPGSPGVAAAGSDPSSPVTAASAAAAQATVQDLSTCMQNIDPNTTQDCIDCMTGSCSAQMKTAGGSCPTFSSCICNGGAMKTCAPMLAKEPACQAAFNAVGACSHQSCAAKCTSAPAGVAPAAGGVPGGQPGQGAPQLVKGGADSCAALTTCCGTMPSPGSNKACLGAAGKNNPDLCATTLQTFKGMGMCH